MIADLLQDRSAAIFLFLVSVIACLLLSMWASPDLGDSPEEFYSKGAYYGPLRTGLALTGDFISAAGVLYITGIVAVAGFDGVVMVIATALSPLMLRLWLAAKLPEARGWSLGDVFSHRLPAVPARRAAAFAALIVSVPLLIAQLGPMGEITAALMGLPGTNGAIACTVVLGVLILSCAAIGGARGADVLQIGKAMAFLVLAPLLALLVLAHFGWDVGRLTDEAARGSGAEDSYFSFGHLFGGGATGAVDMTSMAVTVVLGAAFLPHMISRLTSSAGPREGRAAGRWTTGAVAMMLFAALFLGYGIQALIGAAGLEAAGPRGGNNLLLLAGALDGSEPGDPGFLLTFISCASFLTVMASASVLLLTGSAALSHDLRRARQERNESSRRAHPHTALVVVGAVSIALAVLGHSANPQFWLVLSYTVAASAVLPALCLSLLWKRFTVTGLHWAVYGGTAVTAVLLFFSPGVSGAPDALFPQLDWQVFPLHVPGLVSIPAGFLFAVAGSRTGRPVHRQEPPAAPERVPAGL
ncbi:MULTISPECIES: cation acetate symporter [unclassified Streptomyces]|uniref:sodium:solute symporter family transporter n=1 Tax=unclassified Streptomyces TaxID=2593676 RepID=UPI000BF504C0|nr:cation acetate symporter [Streptomyces sp. Ru87]PGH46985.1 cation acetate symporter [Streptomyces sp. Ru87]